MVLAQGLLLAHRYRLGGRLGRGGAASAYLAHDLVSGEELALKLLDPDLPPSLLQQEFERLRELVHPHLARVREFQVVQVGATQRALYTADLVRGGDLRAGFAQGGFALRPLCDVLDALHTLHRFGVRHGDVKPENVLLDEQGRAVLIDLGCAAPLGHAASTLAGTPGYLAPELSQGQPADARADLYAFGVMLRELGAPAALQPLIARLTASVPAERPSSAREVLAQLGDARDVESSCRGRAPACLGRERELAVASEGLLAVARAQPGPRVVWLEGPPGIGRSRLLRELRHALTGGPVELLEASALAAEPLREALARKLGAVSAGPEALLDQLEELADGRHACALALDDAQQLAGAARDELALVLRALPARGRLAALVASTEAPPCEALVVKLAPLQRKHIDLWVDELVSAPRRDQLLRFTGGYPRYLERTLAALQAGRLREAELSTAALTDDHSLRGLCAALLGLASAELRCLAEVAVLGSSERAPGRLLERELLTRRGQRLELAREADRAALCASLDARLVRTLHARAARALPSDSAQACAAAIDHYVHAGMLREARALFDASLPLLRAEPRALVQRLSTLPHWMTADQLVSAAQLARLAGEAQRALHWLARARRQGAAIASRALQLEAAEVYLALGRPTRALRRVDAMPAELHARVLVRAGHYARASELAQAALVQCAPPERARLLEVAGLAAAYLGEVEQAREQLREALALHEDVRARARGLSLCGFTALRAGHAAEAAAAYSDALALAEPAGLLDLVANALANLASARQSLGAWGAALSTYERALRLARALGRHGSERSLRANLANLALEIGAFERARFELTELEQGTGPAALELSIALYRAELDLLTGAAEQASTRLAAIIERAPPRERLEAQAHAVWAALACGRTPELAPLQGDHAEPDVLARAVEAEAAAAPAERRRAVAERVERALERVRGDEAWTARLEGALASLYRALGADALALEHGARARARYERIALDLAPTLREAFWAHPRRAQLASQLPSGARGRATLSLARVRELNRRLGGLHRRDDLLAFALDAAIELSGAERGFVLLSAAQGFTVALARNMEGARVRRGDWKWSRSIAERVIRTGEPVLTVDAGNDPRFARQASVHAMQLKSVLCAPILGHAGVLGALYLDNRLARARFAPEDAELLLTFADQVAIALAHAELVAELERQQRELARDKQQIAALARGQARQIEQLAEELSSQRAALATRYAYDEIVGRSEAMRRVLSTLDGVIDSDLSVLVQGESGTGKELIARALHMNGARKHKRFVSINCAALPEPLLESELFGHVKGAFTGALTAREGLFVSARGGTLFLDELGELPLAMQAKLLRVLNDGEVRAVGATHCQSVDVRLVCATNRDLRQCVKAGSFREDLYYRVGVVELTLPPLRERHEDIVPIAESILLHRARQLGGPALALTPEAVRALLAHGWPGNVRELQNTLLRASVLAVDGLIRERDLGLAGTRVPPPTVASSREEYERKEAERLLSALESERWNVSRVAKHLGVPRNTLYRKLARYGIQRRDV
jgi:serine/threonine-protein kinase PknK